jgi:hypothetical protein
MLDWVQEEVQLLTNNLDHAMSCHWAHEILIDLKSAINQLGKSQHHFTYH